ncbi:S-layer homology domain-containing protein [Clostridium sp. MD294]|uniref:S-layer homology domain-containing protein n=1 Tax=Clostridium sp. MD294 TaxID=97138 RepID=UPI0002C99C44|nr:S-layer homology domain-containing protein [Clostridium sp. MD294]USF29229.1 hypothetical protein C820_000614 [Clostridium sp. MD294]
MKRAKSRLLAGLLSTAMAFSVVSAPQKVSAATDTSGHWAEASINNWINSGYISGYPDGTFRPNNAISRAEFVTIANKAFGFTSSQGISFSDVKAGYWAYSEIQKGVAAGYVQGDASGTFRPGSAVSRQEAAMMLARLKGYEDDEAASYGYTDRWAMANWAVGAIGAVSRNGVMSGYPDKTFRPQRDLTRAEAVAALQKVANNSNRFGNTGTITNNNYNMNTSTNNNTSSISGSNTSSNINTNTTSRSNSTYDNYVNATVLEGTRMENRTLTGDLLIPRSVGSQNVTLKNVRIKGTLYVEGGSTITLENCNITKVVMDKSNAVLKNNGSSDVEEVYFEQSGRIDGKGYKNVLIDDDSVSEVIIDADVDTLTLDADVDVKLYANANIDLFEITKNADKAKIKLGEDSEVSEMQIYDKVRISGKGKIDTMTVYVSGVRSEIEPRRLIQQDGAKKPNFSYTDEDDDDDDYENLTIDDDDEDFDGDGEDYDRVRIAAEDVTVTDLTAHDDLIVTSAAGDSTIRIEDVTVKGDVYVEGGGDSSVIFEDCTLQGHIYSRKNTSGRYDEAVAIKLRGDTSVKGNIFVTGDTILESNKKLNTVTLNKALSKAFRMEAEAEKLVVNYNNNIQLRGSKTITNGEIASGLTDVSITMDGGKFGTLTARSPVKIEGTGSIDKLLTNQNNTISSGITIGETGDVGDDGAAANYTIKSSIAANSSGYGSISPLGEQTVANGSSKEYRITPNSAYHVAAIVVDGKELDLGGKSYSGFTYTFNNVKANHEIIVSFAEGAGADGSGSASNGTNNGGDDNNKPSEDGYIISTIVNGTGGRVDNDVIKVKEGEDGSVTFTADPGYHIDDITIDAGTAEEKSLRKISESEGIYNKVKYTFKNVIKNHTITATFKAGAGKNETSISSGDDDTPAIKPSGYKYEVTTLLTDLDGNQLTHNDTTGRYYCIAGETIQLIMSELKTDDPNEEFLKTKWAIVNTTTDMNITLTQGENSTLGILKTTENDGHAVMLRVQVYDTSKESNVSAPVYQSDVIELHVDVPLSENPGLMLSNSDQLYCQSNQYILSPQNFTYVPSQATAANDRQNIQWKVVPGSEKIDKVDGQQSLYVGIDDTKTGNGGTVPTLVVKQVYKEGDSITEKTMATPTGEVKIEATIPNGYGKMRDYKKVFTIQFIGTQIIPVKQIMISNDLKTNGVEITGIQEVDLDTEAITKNIEILPENATYQQIEWKIKSDTRANEDIKTATIQAGKNGANTKIVTTGYPGQIVLRPYIKNGMGKDEDFDLFNAETDEQITVTVRVVAPTVTMNKANVDNGTDKDDIIILSAQVTNADKTPYTAITGWQKTYKEKPKETDWEDISGFLTDVDGNGDDIESPDDEGTYRVGYKVQQEDLNTSDNYKGKAVYFRAIATYDKNVDNTPTDNKSISNTISVECKAQAVDFPRTTDNEQTISLTNGVYTIKGADKVTLPSKLDNGTNIDWSISTSDKTIAEIDKTDGQVLVTKGNPDKKFTVTATTSRGETTFDITNTFVPIQKAKSGFDIMNEGGTVIDNAKPGDTVYLVPGKVDPVNATYHAYTGDDKILWLMGANANGTGAASINATKEDDGRYSYTIPDDLSTDTNGKIYFIASWKNGELTSSGNVAATNSNTVGIEIKQPVIPVTGIDFSETVMGDLQPDPAGSTEYKYTISKNDYANDRVQIALSKAKKLPADASTNASIQWSVAVPDELRNYVNFNNQHNLEILKNDPTTGNPGGDVVLTATIEGGTAENQAFIAHLTITIEKTDPVKSPGTGTTTPSTEQSTQQKPPASNATTTPEESNTEQTNKNETVNNENNTNQLPSTENNTNQATNNTNKLPSTGSNTNNQITTGVPDENGFVAVTDISFDDIAGLQPIAGGYAVTSDKSRQTILDLADSITSVNGVSVHTGVKVFPENATNKTVKWSVEKGSPIATAAAGGVNMIPSGKIGVLNNTTNKLTLGTNVSGTFTVSAVVKDGSGEGVDFVKQVTIQVSPQSTTTNVPNTTTPNTSTTTPTQQMPANTIQSSTRQVVSVGTTEVGTSSTNSAGGGTSSKTTTYTENERKLDSTISNADVSIEFSGECKKGISLPLRAVSKSTRQQYTDVDWEIAYDGGTDAKIVNNNRLRATNTGTVTVRAIVYTSSGERMVCTKDIRVSN